MARSWVLYAPNVHIGGGRTLLLALLSSLPSDCSVQAFVDERLDLPAAVAKGLSVHRVRPTLIHRLQAELLLRRASDRADVVLCFGNLPPLFGLRSQVIVFLQNRYAVEQLSTRGFPRQARVRMAIERSWLRLFSTHADTFVVQTPSMKESLESLLGAQASVRIMPFVTANAQLYGRKQDPLCTAGDAHEFVYVASGEPHKNHRVLIDAWCLLADEGIFPTLYLTLSPKAWPELCDWIDRTKRPHSLRVENLGYVSSKDLYTSGRALIYPSSAESFGIPLVEARQAGLPILASELDYVRDVVDPEETFDARSAVSIARAVKRFLGEAEHPLPLLDAKGFFSKLEELLIGDD